MIPNQSEVQTCMSCAETETRWQRDVEHLEREIHFLEGEKEEAFQRVAELEFHNRRLERDNYRLRTQNEEPLTKRGAKEHAEITEWLRAWNDRRLQIPGARKVKDETLGADSSNGKQVRAARRTWSHDEMMDCIRGASISDWWTANTKRWRLATLIGEGPDFKRDQKIQDHIDRWRSYQDLLERGFPDDFARQQVQRKLPDLDLIPFGKVECPGCGYERCRCGTGLAA